MLFYQLCVCVCIVYGYGYRYTNGNWPINWFCAAIKTIITHFFCSFSYASFHLNLYVAVLFVVSFRLYSDVCLLFTASAYLVFVVAVVDVIIQLMLHSSFHYLSCFPFVVVAAVLLYCFPFLIG